MELNWILAACALLFSLGLVAAVHRLITGHIEIKSASGKAILGMDAVAVGVLLAAFILGEVGALAQSLKPGSNAHAGLTWHDMRLVLGTVGASLLIYVAIDKLRQWNVSTKNPP